jgi:hypothetical protein
LVLSELVIVVEHQMNNFSAISWREQVTFDEMMKMSTLYQTNTDLNLYSASSLKQQSAGKHVSPLRHIIVIPSRPVLSLSLLCCILSEEATNTNVIVFGMTQSGLKTTMYHA